MTKVLLLHLAFPPQHGLPKPPRTLRKGKKMHHPAPPPTVLHTLPVWSHVPEVARLVQQTAVPSTLAHLRPPAAGRPR